LIGIPFEEKGQEGVRYFTDEKAADAAVPHSLLPSGAAPPSAPSAPTRAGANARFRIAETLAARHTSHGGQADRSRLDDDRAVVVSRAASLP
jgi:hypothetical protein